MNDRPKHPLVKLKPNRIALHLKRNQTHATRALLLGISFAVCSGLVLFTSSLTSMREMRTRLANEGRGLLCQHDRHTTHEVHQPYFRASRWYVDLSSGIARDLYTTDIVAMGLRHPHATLHSLFGVREDIIVQQSDERSGNSNDKYFCFLRC